MNAYAICIPEMRNGRGYDEPPEPYMPCGIFIANTGNEAKYMALVSWANSLYSGVYHDDWINLRARIIEYGQGPQGQVGWDDGEFFHVLPAGEVKGHGPFVDYLWNGWPESYRVEAKEQE